MRTKTTTKRTTKTAAAPNWLLVVAKAAEAKAETLQQQAKEG